MRFWIMLAANTKKYVKNYKNIIFMLFLPLVISCLISFFNDNSKDPSYIKIAVINLDRGSLGKKLIGDLGVKDVFYNKKKGIEAAQNSSFAAVYELSTDFSYDVENGIKPIINSYRVKGGNATKIFEESIEEYVNISIKINALKGSGIIANEKDQQGSLLRADYKPKNSILNSNGYGFLMFIIFFMFISTNSFSMDLLKLRNNKILERFTSTENKGSSIMGSIYLSMVIVQSSMFFLCFIVMHILFNVKLPNLSILVLNIIITSILSISLCILLVRIFKDDKIASLIISLTSMTMYSLYIVLNSFGHKTFITNTICKFIPFYWIMNSIENNIIFPNAIILILMAGALFTAGSIKYSNFAMKE